MSFRLQLARRIKENQVCLGNADTYLLWKLTGEKVYATDYSSASSTGLYDTYQVGYFVIGEEPKISNGGLAEFS